MKLGFMFRIGALYLFKKTNIKKYYTIAYWHSKKSLTWRWWLSLNIKSNLKANNYFRKSHQGRHYHWGFKIPFTTLFLSYDSQPTMLKSK